MILGLLRSYTNVDQAILWVAARDWGRFQLHQPNYYGQNYGSTFEAIPLEMLRRLGVPLHNGLPLVLSAMALGSWWLLGAAALRRQNHVAAVLAFAAPMVLTSYYVFYTSYYGAAFGRFAAVAGSAVLLAGSRRRTTLAVAWGIAMFGTAIDPSAAVLTLPVLAFALLERNSTRADILAVLLGSTPAVAWFALTRLFYVVYPDRIFFPLIAHASLTGFTWSLKHPTRKWAMFAPDLLQLWWLLPLTATILVVVLVRRKERTTAIPAVIFAAVALIAMTIDPLGPLRDEHPVVLLPAARVMLAVPLAVWFLVLVVSDRQVSGRRRSSMKPLIVAISAVAIASAAVRFVDFDGRVRSIARDAEGPSYDPIQSVAAVERRCRAAARLAAAEGAQLVVFHEPAAVYRSTLAYQCAALENDDIDTLEPFTEHRTWRLYDERKRRRKRLLIFGVPPKFCDVAVERGFGCHLVSRKPEVAAALTFRSTSALNVLRQLGVPIRAFGRHCHPRLTICE